MTYQSCDSYFVESQDTGVLTAAQGARDCAKLYARRRQEDMADELSRLTDEEYGEDIMRHMLRMEVNRLDCCPVFSYTDDQQEETLADVASIDIQEEIQWFMRPYLLDFLIEAHTFFQLLPETLYLAVNLLDRYCSRRVVYKRHYQLVGCASLLIAAKYGDRKERVPIIRELKSMCCSLYDEEMFTQMEWHVLNTLDWTIGAPTVDGFLQIFMQEDYDDIDVQHMAWYISEIALYHKEFVSVKPSVMARSSLALARGILYRPELSDGAWNHVEQITLLRLSQLLHQPSQALARKYASPHLSRSSARLEKFLAEQVPVMRSDPPPTPPCEGSGISQKGCSGADIYSTPQKVSHNHKIVHGYTTPPITPEGEFFGLSGSDVKGYQSHVARRPITPTPLGSHEYSQQTYEQYQPGMMH
ncbi:MAG: hypothetical protein M1818_002929 [Claussenomyces sp. TS43310]|nr:MAG: hypothetical protein M1818_002929 [Claussenomyces sp. TS43310]